MAAIKTLAGLSGLSSNWDSYQADAPNELAIRLARNVLGELVVLDFQPTSVDASAEGGVCMSFLQSER